MNILDMMEDDEEVFFESDGTVRVRKTSEAQSDGRVVRIDLIIDRFDFVVARDPITLMKDRLKKMRMEFDAGRE
jgi:hypothetical protein